MTQLFTDFSEYPVGSPPSDWTYIKRNSGNSASRTVAEVSDGPGGVPVHVYRLTSNENDRQITLWDSVTALSDRADSEQAMLMRWTSRAEAGYSFRPTARFGDLSTPVYYTGGIESGGTPDGLRITRQNDVIGSSPYNQPLNDWGWVKFRAVGDTFQLKAWPYGDPEPEEWAVTATDSTYTTGDTGIFWYNTSQTMEIARIGVGTGGDVAPLAAIPTIITAPTTPFSASWTPGAAGTYQITPVARKSDGTTVRGSKVKVTVS